MRTALRLLFLLAVATVPGSLIPQSGVDPLGVRQWEQRWPDVSSWLARLGFFNVYGSAWFSAVYLLLMVSLGGCLVPRLRHYLRRLAAAPGTMRSAEHLQGPWWVELPRPRPTLTQLRTRLRLRGAKTAWDGETLCVTRGHAREAGNLVFHGSILAVLLAFAWGTLTTFTGGVILVEGNTFTSTPSQYDEIVPGRLFDPGRDLDTFSLSLDDFDAEFTGRGQPIDFSAELSTSDGTSEVIEVNHPMSVEDTDVFLVGHGYAPVISVEDGRGKVVYEGPVTFLPQDASLQSFGVIKVPDAQPEGLAFDGELYPTYAAAEDGTDVTLHPDTLVPRIRFTAWTGDLGMSAAQSVYALDTSRMTAVTRSDGEPRSWLLGPGDELSLPGGRGQLRFEGVRPWAKLQMSSSAAEPLALGSVVVGLLGLLASLFSRPRTYWVTEHPEGWRVSTSRSTDPTVIERDVRTLWSTRHSRGSSHA